MRKLMLVFLALGLALILSACKSNPEVSKAILSVNRVVYETKAEIESNYTAEKIQTSNDVEMYHLMSNGTVSKIVPARVELLGVGQDGIYEARVFSANSSIPLVFKVFITSEITGEFEPYSVLSFTYGIETKAEQEAAVLEAIAPSIGLPITTDNLTMLVASYNQTVIQTIYDSSQLTVDTGNWDLLGQGVVPNNSVKFNAIVTVSVTGNEELSIQFDGYTRRSSRLPIQTRIASWYWDWILVIPIAFIISFFGSLFGNSFAWGIIFATIIVRTLAWPIYAKSNDSTIKMSLANPELQRVQAKYAGRKDPASQQKLQLETMQIYKKHGISVLGCLTPLLQMPIFLAMYQAVTRVIIPGGIFYSNVEHQMFFFGLVDLAGGGISDPAAIILSVIVGATMFLLNRISTKRPAYLKNTGTQVKSEQAIQTEKTMKIVSYVMIVIMVGTALQYNALALYWVVGNVFSLGQTLINRKLAERKYHKKKNALV